MNICKDSWEQKRLMYNLFHMNRRNPRNIANYRCPMDKKGFYIYPSTYQVPGEWCIRQHYYQYHTSNGIYRYYSEKRPGLAHGSQIYTGLYHVYF